MDAKIQDHFLPMVEMVPIHFPVPRETLLIWDLFPATEAQKPRYLRDASDAGIYMTEKKLIQRLQQQLRWRGIRRPEVGYGTIIAGAPEEAGRRVRRYVGRPINRARKRSANVFASTHILDQQTRAEPAERAHVSPANITISKSAKTIANEITAVIPITAEDVIGTFIRSERKVLRLWTEASALKEDIARQFARVAAIKVIHVIVLHPWSPRHVITICSSISTRSWWIDTFMTRMATSDQYKRKAA